MLIDDCHSFTVSKTVIKDCWPLLAWQGKLKLVLREKGRIKIKNVDAQVFAKFLDFAIKCAAKLNSGYLHTIALVADDGAVSRLLGKQFFDGSDLNLHSAEQMLDRFLLGTGLSTFDRSTIIENCKTHDFATIFHIRCLRVLPFLNCWVFFYVRQRTSHVGRLFFSPCGSIMTRVGVAEHATAFLRE